MAKSKKATKPKVKKAKVPKKHPLSRKTTKRVNRKPTVRKLHSVGKDVTMPATETPASVPEAVATAADEQAAKGAEKAPSVPVGAPTAVYDAVAGTPEDPSEVHPNQLALPDTEEFVAKAEVPPDTSTPEAEVDHTPSLPVKDAPIGRKVYKSRAEKFVAKANKRIARYAKWRMVDGEPVLVLTVPKAGKLKVKVRVGSKSKLGQTATVVPESGIYEAKLLTVGRTPDNNPIGVVILS